MSVALHRAQGGDVFDLARAYPRLVRSMKWAAVLCETEAGAALRDYLCAREGIYPADLLRYGGGEAVCHYGGPLKLLQNAIRMRNAARLCYGVPTVGATL